MFENVHKFKCSIGMKWHDVWDLLKNTSATSVDLFSAQEGVRGAGLRCPVGGRRPQSPAHLPLPEWTWERSREMSFPLSWSICQEHQSNLRIEESKPLRWNASDRVSGALSLVYFQNVAAADMFIISSQTCWECGCGAPLAHQQHLSSVDRVLLSAFLPEGPMGDHGRLPRISPWPWGVQAAHPPRGWPAAARGQDGMCGQHRLAFEWQMCPYPHFTTPTWGSSWSTGDLRPWAWDLAAVRLSPGWVCVAVCPVGNSHSVHNLLELPCSHGSWALLRAKPPLVYRIRASWVCVSAWVRLPCPESHFRRAGTSLWETGVSRLLEWVENPL